MKVVPGGCVLGTAVKMEGGIKGLFKEVAQGKAHLLVTTAKQCRKEDQGLRPSRRDEDV